MQFSFLLAVYSLEDDRALCYTDFKMGLCGQSDRKAV